MLAADVLAPGRYDDLLWRSVEALVPVLVVLVALAAVALLVAWLVVDAPSRRRSVRERARARRVLASGGVLHD